MDDEVEIYENCFRFMRKTIEYSEFKIAYFFHR